MTVAIRSQQPPGSSPGDHGNVVLLLGVPADPSSLAVVRQSVAGAGTALGLSPGVVADLRLALSETCGAAIRRMHGTGRLEVEASADAAALRVVVRDDAPRAILGEGELPLPLVAAITDAVELTQVPGGGTEVSMTFRIPQAA